MIVLRIVPLSGLQEQVLLTTSNVAEHVVQKPEESHLMQGKGHG